VRRPGLSDAEEVVTAARPQALIAASSDLLPTMLMTRVCDQIADLDRQLIRQAKAIPVCRRFMTVPGVGVVVALSVRAAIDDPGRFAKSPSVAHLKGRPAVLYRSEETVRRRS